MNLFRNIKFWIVLFFIIRLYGITNPPLEVAHNWRQTTVTMVSRNFLETDNNILYPRIDFAGDKTGITGMEFPLLNYLIYIFSEIFGYQHWYGRLINLIISSLGLLFYFKIIKKYFDENIAFYSTFILLFSIWFIYSRKIMPDTFSISFIIFSIYYGTNFFEEKIKQKRIFYLLLYIIFSALGSLSKISSTYLLVIFAIFLFNKNILLKRKVIFSIATVISLSYTYYWYFYWVPFLVENYGFQHFFMGKNLLIGIHEIFSDIPGVLKCFYDNTLKYIGFLLFLFGLVISIIKKEKIYLLTLIIFFLGFSVIIFKIGSGFSHHVYYMTLFAPVMALFAARALIVVKKQSYIIIILFAIATECIANYQQDFRIHEKDAAIINLENDLNRFSDLNDLILINSGEYPTPMYFAHRKGWVNQNEKINNQDYIYKLKDKGLKYIVILKRTFGTEIQLKYPIIFNNQDYCIYSLVDY